MVVPKYPYSGVFLTEMPEIEPSYGGGQSLHRGVIWQVPISASTGVRSSRSRWIEAVLLGGRIQITPRCSLDPPHSFTFVPVVVSQGIGQLTTGCRGAGCSVVCGFSSFEFAIQYFRHHTIRLGGRADVDAVRRDHMLVAVEKQRTASEPHCI